MASERTLSAEGGPASSGLPPLLRWAGSAPPGDGVGSAGRRLVDFYTHGVTFPVPRVLDAGLILLGLSTTDPAAEAAWAEAEDARLVAEAVSAALRAAAARAAGGGDEAARQLQLAATAAASAAGPACKRLSLLSPPTSDAARNAQEQALFAKLAQEKAARAEANRLASETRRLAKGDWKCPSCGTMNFLDRRARAGVPRSRCSRRGW